MEEKKHLASAKWVMENLDNPDLVVLDATETANIAGLKSDFEGIQIKGSQFFDLQNKFSAQCDLPHTLVSPQVFEEECRALGINSSSQIVVYDSLGIYFSPRVWWMFKAMGHENVAVLDGGIPAWVNAGYATEPKQIHSSKRGDFVAKFQPEAVKNLAFIRDNLQTRNALVVDARSTARFKGHAPEPRHGLSSGHMPGSENIPFTEVLAGGKYKTQNELREVFNEVLKDGRPLVFSCGSGLTACITLLACDLVSNRPKFIYDGSWTEYAQAENVTIEKELD